ncbi:hypothetical protein SDC9_83445 [bioreactor metagenome]|uniref:Uncharacterized protein n=1 Tax=bioreactor metagenome TaxID=1076179 RepID=A0A644ZA41_9ZZZZ
MIEPDVRNDREFRRVDYVCRIKLSAHADFEDDDIDVPSKKELESDDRNQFKLGRLIRHRVRKGTHIRGDSREFFIANGFAVHLHAFVKAVDKRRDVKPSAVARCGEDAREHRRGGTFAVRAGNMDELQRAVRVADAFQQFVGAFKTETAAAPGDLMDIRQRLFVVHRALRQSILNRRTFLEEVCALCLIADQPVKQADNQRVGDGYHGNGKRARGEHAEKRDSKECGKRKTFKQK